MNFSLCNIYEQVTNVDKKHLTTFVSRIYSLVVLDLYSY